MWMELIMIQLYYGKAYHPPNSQNAQFGPLLRNGKLIFVLVIHGYEMRSIWGEHNIPTAQYSDHWNLFQECPLFQHPNIPTAKYSDTFSPSMIKFQC